ncbi:unnamed protein product (macronuclear) [Paramecium tetraurelia]|uniref:Uncharacterized protein n=1 Tax=Paramecium tetraurelia TaxID=5888 RepID=A0DZS6_PARTE|nr:uncharacterized protein GSPATT00021711001 [Paramecium tetraurelia]CAK88543.1 unnamed protein product [Paramecium tetraurelia]|eukprot:XP_001455940.1 hypothetical protein (macronuclear) [Paramecium tetraurelia strain d4-2]
MRRNQRELIFSKKRILELPIQISDNNQAILILQGISQNQISLTTFFQQLTLLLPQFTELHLQTLPYIQQATAQYIYEIDQSNRQINDDDLEISECTVLEMLLYLNQLTYYVKIDFSMDDLLDLLLKILKATNKFKILDRICQVLYNILLDFPDAQALLLQQNLPTMLTNKYLTNTNFDLLNLKNLLMILHKLVKIGYHEYNLIHPILHKLQNSSNVQQSQYVEVMEYFFQFLANCSSNYDPQIIQQVQLFEKFLEFQYVRWSVDLLFKYDKNYNLVCNIYQFLNNLSLAACGSSMIDQGILSVIQVHLNEKSVPQILIYSLLTNLIVDDLTSILQCGILIRIPAMFRLGFPNSDYIPELIYCITAAFSKADENQIQDLTKIQLTDCLVTYVADLPQELLDLELCQKIFRILQSIIHLQNQESQEDNYELEKLKNNTMFIMRCNHIFGLNKDYYCETLLNILFEM